MTSPGSQSHVALIVLRVFLAAGCAESNWARSFASAATHFFRSDARSRHRVRLDSSSMMASALSLTRSSNRPARDWAAAGANQRIGPSSDRPARRTSSREACRWPADLTDLAHILPPFIAHVARGLVGRVAITRRPLRLWPYSEGNTATGTARRGAGRSGDCRSRWAAGSGRRGGGRVRSRHGT